MSDFQKWSVLAFRAMDDAGRVLMTIEPESTTEGERLDQLKATIRELLTQCVLLNGLCTRRQLDERFGFGKLDTDALNVQLGLEQQAEPVQEPQLKRIHPLDIPLEVFVADLSTRPRNVINAEMMYFINFGDEFMKPPFTVRHLIMFSRKELRKWPNLGKRSLNEIEEMLRSRGLQLWDEHDERSLSLLREHPTYYTTPPQRKPLTDEMRKQMKEASDNMEMRGAFANGWLSAEAAHGIKEGT